MMHSLSDLADALPAVRTLWERAPDLQGATNVERSFRRRGLELLETTCAILQEVPQLRCIGSIFPQATVSSPKHCGRESPLRSRWVKKPPRPCRTACGCYAHCAWETTSSGSSIVLNINQALGVPHKQLPGMDTWELTRQTLPEMFRTLVGAATWAAMAEGELAQSLPLSPGVMSSCKPRM